MKERALIRCMGNPPPQRKNGQYPELYFGSPSKDELYEEGAREKKKFTGFTPYRGPTYWVEPGGPRRNARGKETAPS